MLFFDPGRDGRGPQQLLVENIFAKSDDQPRFPGLGYQQCRECTTAQLAVNIPRSSS
jgi:hypothetical protein